MVQPNSTEKTMTLERFQALVLRLGNQVFVRHYHWLNYPHDPPLMGIEMIGQAPNGKKKAVTDLRKKRLSPKTDLMRTKSESPDCSGLMEERGNARRLGLVIDGTNDAHSMRQNRAGVKPTARGPSGPPQPFPCRAPKSE